MSSNALNAVEAFISAVNRHDVSNLSRLMSAHHRFVDAGGRVVSGREDMTAGWAEYFRMFPEYQIQVETILADEAWVAVFGSASGTYNGKRGTVEENRITMPAAWRVSVEENEITHWQVYADWTEGWKTIEKDNASDAAIALISAE